MHLRGEMIKIVYVYAYYEGKENIMEQIYFGNLPEIYIYEYK